MSEIDKYGIEFSKLYGRFMRLEILIKDRAFDVITKYYTGTSYKVFFDFFKSLSSIGKYLKKDKNKKEFSVLKKIIDLPISDREKLKRLINKLYLPELLRFVLRFKEFDRKELRPYFYCKIPSHTDVLWAKRHLFKDFRNDIAHYNFERYKQNKKQYWDALQQFEIHMGHNITGVQKLPYFNSKPTTRMILESIYTLRPDLFSGSKEHNYNKDRLLLELFDDIAVYNGYETWNLPSPWNVLRGMFKFKARNSNLFPKRAIKNIENLEQLDEEKIVLASQLGLFE